MCGGAKTARMPPLTSFIFLGLRHRFAYRSHAGGPRSRINMDIFGTLFFLKTRNILLRSRLWSCVIILSFLTLFLCAAFEAAHLRFY